MTQLLLSKNPETILVSPNYRF